MNTQGPPGARRKKIRKKKDEVRLKHLLDEGRFSGMMMMIVASIAYIAMYTCQTVLSLQQVSVEGNCYARFTHDSNHNSCCMSGAPGYLALV